MGGQTNSKALLIGNGNNTKAINRSIKGRASIEKKRQKKFQQANEFSALSPDAGKDLNIIAGDDYFTQRKNQRNELKRLAPNVTSSKQPAPDNEQQLIDEIVLDGKQRYKDSIENNRPPSDFIIKSRKIFQKIPVPNSRQT